MNYRLILILSLALFLGTMLASAEDYLIIHTADGETSINLAEIDSITFSTVEDEDPEPGEERDFPLTDDVNITMVWIPPGEFMMGAHDDEQGGEPFEKPRHRVTLDNGFWIGKYEFTQTQWEAIMDDNPSHFDGENLPVEQVSWNDVHSFLENVDRSFRLPSEAEWEYACRAGTETRYPWGDDPDYEEIDDYAWYDENSDNRTHYVGEKRASNEWDLFDMHGNVWEWCEDDWHDNYDGAPNDGRAWVGDYDSEGVTRGGSYTYRSWRCRSASRNITARDYHHANTGFRLVRDR
ncbi:formylglycine-generating enzyme family protein [bacterium]|nr:formylglycine-generating enzyme family protein [bacterium]